MTNVQDEKECSAKLMKYEDEIEICDADKPMGFLGGCAFVFGSIMGTGIFISVSDTFNVFFSNNILVVILIWMFGGLVSMIGSLCYAELGSRFPQTGGECVYYKEILGKCWMITLIFNCFNKRVVMKCLVAFSFMKLFTLVVVISFGAYSMIRGNVRDWKSISKFEGFDFVKLSSAFVGVCWSFEGWNSLALKAGDMRNPSVNLLLSSVIGVSAITITYILTAISYSSVLGYSQVRISETVALSFAKLTLGTFYPIISIMIFLSSLGSAVSNLYTCGGVTTYAGLEEILPSFFSLVHKKSRIPFISIISI
ncbi:hypothetical protein MXB_2794, partial [Myxobolus squamalis]